MKGALLNSSPVREGVQLPAEPDRPNNPQTLVHTASHKCPVKVKQHVAAFSSLRFFWWLSLLDTYPKFLLFSCIF